MGMSGESGLRRCLLFLGGRVVSQQGIGVTYGCDNYALKTYLP